MGTVVCVALPLRLERTIIATSKSCLCRCEGYNTHKHTHAHTALIWELDSLRLQVPIKHGAPLKVFQAQDKFLYIANITPNYSPPWACFYSQMLHTHTPIQMQGRCIHLPSIDDEFHEVTKMLAHLLTPTTTQIVLRTHSIVHMYTHSHPKI